jgi:hyperosmotically inducible periplasmic protein
MNQFSSARSPAQREISSGRITKVTTSPKKWAKQLTLMGATLIFSASLGANPTRQSGQQPAPDNSRTNQGDANQGATTADQQKMNSADRETSRQIRSASVKDKTLSTYSHNIKIITQNGKVTLKGPVRSDDEKANIEAKAGAIAGPENVTDLLTVAPAK